MVDWVTMSKAAATGSISAFRRTKGANGLIQILNEHSYVMAQYHERSGVVQWQRVVSASQKATLEEWIRTK